MTCAKTVLKGLRAQTWVDTLQLSRAAWPELESHSLGEICNHFNLENKVTSLVPNKTWHDALYDAVASLLFLRPFSFLRRSV